MTHQPTDVTIRFDSDKYKELYSIWNNYKGDDSTDFLLLLALMGVKHNRRISLDERNVDKGDEHTFSRTVYQRNEVKMESIMGLITILSHIDEDKDIVLNQKAFAKMYNFDLPFLKLPNVKAFYESIIGGISPLYEIITELGTEPQDIANALYDQVVEEEDEMSLIIAKMIAEEDIFDE